MGVKIKEFLLKNKLILAGLFLFFGMLIIVLFPSFSEKTSTSLWDGSVATKFSQGSGLVDDPYVINDGSELAYFFTLINGDNNTEYYNKYYEKIRKKHYLFCGLHSFDITGPVKQITHS